MKKHNCITRLFASLAILAFLLSPVGILAHPTPVHAEVVATYTVNDTSDLVDDNVSDGICHTVSGTCTLRAAIQSASYSSSVDTISLQSNEIYTLAIGGAGEDNGATGDLDVKYRTTINGNGSTIDANGLDRVFDIRETTTLNDLSIINGYVTSAGGGAIYFYVSTSGKSLTLNNVTATDNNADAGGALYTAGNYYSAFISGSEFRHNSNGALMFAMTGSSLNVSDSIITDNTNTGSGGAIVVPTASTLNISNVWMQNNEATIYGGAISVSAVTNLNITDSMILDNTAGQNGGGIYHDQGSNLTLTNTQVISNHASTFMGGGIYLGNGNLVLQNGTRIDGNTAQTFGGGLFVANQSGSSKTVTITDSTITNNNAYTSDGGGIHLSGYVSSGSIITTSILRSRISGNTSMGHGGGAYLALTNATITDSMINGNTTAGGTSNGGGIYYTDSNLANTTLSINRSAIVHNRTFAKGGGLANVTTRAGTGTSITSSTISENTAGTSDQGGGIYWGNGINTIGYSTITRNSAGTGGGISMAAGSLFVEGTILAGNTASTAKPDCNVTVYGSGGYNLVGDDTGCTPGAWTTGDQHGTAGDPLDPLLGALANNGGYSMTHQVLPGSPALDAGGGLADGCPGNDQRSIPRPTESNGGGDALCETGAYETGTLVRLLQPDLYAPENSGSIEYLVAILPAYDGTLQVDYATADLTAVNGDDYKSSSGTLDFSAGDTTKAIPVEILQDNDNEADETFELALSLHPGSPADVFLESAYGDGQVTILDDDPATSSPTVQFTSAYYKVDENGAFAFLSVSLSEVSDETVMVGYRTQDLTALDEHSPDADYIDTAEELTFEPGETVKTFSVSIQADALIEADIEFFKVELFNPLNAALGGPDVALVYILDDDQDDYGEESMLHFNAPTVMVYEDPSGSELSFKLYRTGETSSAASINWETHYGTAGESDLTPSSGSITLAPYETMRMVTLDLVLDDLLEEGDETFTITIGDSLDATRTGPNPLVVVILDDDRSTEPIRLFFEDDQSSHIEDTAPIPLTVSLSADHDYNISLRVASVAGTATDDLDYYSMGELLLFEPHEMTKTVNVMLKEDALVEGDEYVTFVAYDVTGAALGQPAHHDMTITDDDFVYGSCTLSFAGTSFAVNEIAGYIPIGVHPDGACPLPMVAWLKTTDGTAEAGSDYVTPEAWVFWAPGDDVDQFFNIQILDDSSYEPMESINLSMLRLLNAVLVEPSEAPLYIRENDFWLSFLPVLIWP